MNNRDIAKVGFAVLAAVMSYNFADTIVHAEETSVEPVKETAPVENQDDLTDVIEAVVEDTNVPENTEETNVPESTEETEGRWRDVCGCHTGMADFLRQQSERRISPYRCVQNKTAKWG